MIIIEKRKSIYLITLIVSVFSLILTKNLYIENSLASSLVCVLFCFVYLFFLFSFYSKSEDIFVFAFGVMLFLFSNGCAILKMLNVAEIDIYIYRINRFTNEAINSAYLYNTLCLGSFVFGAILVKKNCYNCEDDYKHFVPNDNWDNILNLAGGILFYPFAPFYIFFSLRKMILSQSFGFIYLYSDAFTYTGVLGIIDRYSILVVPGAFLLSFGNRKNKFKCIFPILFLLVCSMFTLLSGDRAGPAGIIFGSVWYLYINRKILKIGINRKVRVYLVFLFYLGASLMAFIADFRTQSGRNFSNFIINYFEYCIKFQVIRDVVNETGISIRPLLEVKSFMEYGSIEPLYGTSYLGALIMLLPRFLRTSFYNYAVNCHWIELENYITSLTGLNYGLGFSQQAECFYNFSSMGWIVMCILGIFIQKVFHIKRSNTLYFYVKFCLLPGLFEALMILTRASSLLLIKNVFIYLIIPYVLVLICQSILKYKNNN